VFPSGGKKKIPRHFRQTKKKERILNDPRRIQKKGKDHLERQAFVEREQGAATLQPKEKNR